MKKYLCFFFAILNTILLGQDVLLIDSTIHSGFELPNSGFTIGTKYNYDSNLRIKSKISESAQINYEYGVRSTLKIRSNDLSESKSYELTITNANGETTNHSRFHIPNGTNDTVYYSLYSRDLNIYDQTKGIKSYQFDSNNEPYLSGLSNYEYNENRQLTLLKIRRYDTSGVILRELIFNYRYNEDKNLQSEVYTQNVFDPVWTYQDSTAYSYDELGRLVSKQKFENGEVQNQSTIEYFDDKEIETFANKTNPYSQLQRFYSESPHFPYDTIIEYDYHNDAFYLQRRKFFKDVTIDNEDYDLAILENESYYNEEDGSLLNFRQLKTMYNYHNIEVDETEDEIDFQIISNPTPASYYFNIMVSSNHFDMIRIYDAQGKLYKSYNSSSFTVQNIKAPDLPGMYYVQLIRDNKAVSETKEMMVY